MDKNIDFIDFVVDPQGVCMDVRGQSHAPKTTWTLPVENDSELSFPDKPGVILIPVGAMVSLLIILLSTIASCG